MLSIRRRAISYYKFFHSLSWKRMGSTKTGYSSENSLLALKLISKDKQIFVSSGILMIFMTCLNRFVSLNSILASSVLVYCRMALIAPCLTCSLSFSKRVSSSSAIYLVSWFSSASIFNNVINNESTI